MIKQMKLDLENDPKNPLIQVLATVELMIESKYEECINRARQLQRMMPNNPLLMLVLFQCYTETGEYDLAIIELKKVFNQIADERVIKILDEEYKNEGFKKALNAAADEWVERPNFASAQHAIMLYAYGGNTDKALYWLEKAYIRRDPANPYIGVVPNLRPYHDEPRYIEIMQRMNLPLGKFQ
jgi:predicted Zn-dependent protease